MLLDFSTLEPRKIYHWMASTIAPRPVAWVSSLSGDGIANLAPFSFFQMITATPPTLMISPLLQSDGSIKDTTRNIQDTGEFVVNLVPFALVGQMNETSFSYAAGVSEIERCGIETLASTQVKPQRVAGAPVSFECRLASIMPYPPHAPSCHVIFGEVVAAHVDEGILDGEQKQIDPAKLDIVSRMGANWYGRTNADSNFTLQRPTGWDTPLKAP